MRFERRKSSAEEHAVGAVGLAGKCLVKVSCVKVREETEWRTS